MSRSSSELEDAPSASHSPVGADERLFEPPSGGAYRAIRGKPFLIALFAILLAAAGVALGHVKEKSMQLYTASATLQVGEVNPNAPGFYSYVESASELATAYSRALTAEPVLATVEKKLGLSHARASSRLSAAPVPQAPVFRVIATGSTSKSAIALANVASSALVSYIRSTSEANAETSALYHEYREAALGLKKESTTVASLRRQHASGLAIARAEADASAAHAKLRALGVAYTEAVSSESPRTKFVNLLANATSTTNDKHSKMELYGLIGLLVGILVGSGLAIALYTRKRAATPAHPKDATT